MPARQQQSTDKHDTNCKQNTYRTGTAQDCKRVHPRNMQRVPLLLRLSKPLETPCVLFFVLPSTCTSDSREVSMTQPSRTAVLGLYKSLRRQGSRLMVSSLATVFISLTHTLSVLRQQRAVLLIRMQNQRISRRAVLLLLLLGLSSR